MKLREAVGHGGGRKGVRIANDLLVIPPLFVLLVSQQPAVNLHAWSVATEKEIAISIIQGHYMSL